MSEESGYRHVTVDELPDAPSPTDHKREVDEAVGAEHLGFNVYVAQPGQRLPWAYHRHPDHEELFYVVAGRVAADTADGTLTLETGDALFVPPDHPNELRAVGEEPARVVAAGAPKASDGAVLSAECPACGETTGRDYEVDGEDYVLSCGACGAQTDRLTPGPDPE